MLESEALISVRRGARGGAHVHAPNGDVAARYAGLVLQFRGTTLADVYTARKVIELPAVAQLAHDRPDDALRALDENLAAARTHMDDPSMLIRLQERFHLVLVRHGGNQTLATFAEMLHHIIEFTARPTSAGGRGAGRAQGRQAG